MRVTFVISSLGMGGAERTMSIMANYWARKNWDVTLLCLDESSAPFFRLEPNVRHVALDVSSTSRNIVTGLKNNLARVRALRAAIVRSKADVVISFMETLNILTIVSTRFLKIPVIVSEHMLPWVPLNAYGGTRSSGSANAWKLLRVLTYPLSSLLVVLTAESRQYYSARMQARTKIIPNCVVYSPEDPAALPVGTSRPVIFAMGRLADQKGFDLLLTAFSRLAGAFPDWSLVIMGEGPLRGELQDLVARLGIGQRVHLIGAVAAPYAYLQAGDLFVLSSRFEAFPNALLEAMAAGLPVVSYECCEGVRDIVRDNIDGVLVPPADVDALSRAMATVMGDATLRSRLAARAVDVRERFSLERVMRMWEDAIRGVRSNAS